jgi:hypothetical protein
MGTRGQSRKKATLNDIAEDAKIVDDKEKNDKVVAEKAEKSADKIAAAEKSTEKSTEKKSALTNPEDIDTNFEFEKPPTQSSNPLNIPLANETHKEGKTMSNLGFDMEDDTPPPPPPQSDKKVTASFEDEQRYGSGVIDDVPPPSPDERDIFDDYEGGEGNFDAEGGRALPDDFVAWSAEKQAEWIVGTELVVAHGFIQNRAKISMISIRQKILKYNVPKDIAQQVVEVVKSYNDEVENQLQLSSEARKALKGSWAAVLKQYSNISEKITPEVALLINHGLFFGQLIIQGNAIRKQGAATVAEIIAVFKAHAVETKYNSPEKNPDMKSEKKPE